MNKKMNEEEAYYFYVETEILGLRNALASLLPKEDLFLLEEDFKQIDEFIYVGEYGLAFEDLCAVIKDANVKMPVQCKRKIFTLGTLMDIEEDKWHGIQYSDSDDLKKESG